MPRHESTEPRAGTACTRTMLVMTMVTFLAACQPSDRRPGLWLNGDVADDVPTDWSFTDAHPEIYVEVSTPYWLPHSVTIWCGQVGGRLYIGARDADTKNWPGWLERDRDIRLKIGDTVYPVTAEDVTADDELEAVRAAYETKYGLPPGAGGAKRSVTYWRVAARD